MTPYIIIFTTYLIAMPLANGGCPFKAWGQAAALLLIFAGIYAGLTTFTP